MDKTSDTLRTDDREEWVAWVTTRCMAGDNEPIWYVVSLPQQMKKLHELVIAECMRRGNPPLYESSGYVHFSNGAILMRIERWKMSWAAKGKILGIYYPSWIKWREKWIA